MAKLQRMLKVKTTLSSFDVDANIVIIIVTVIVIIFGLNRPLDQ